MLIGACSVLVGCSKTPTVAPFVTNPTEPWEDKLAQERREQEIENRKLPHEPHAVVEGYGYEQKPDEDKHSVIVRTLADIVAFPLRGAAWLARTVL
jgi:hypothetical protein